MNRRDMIIITVLLNVALLAALLAMTMNDAVEGKKKEEEKPLPVAIAPLGVSGTSALSRSAASVIPLGEEELDHLLRDFPTTPAVYMQVEEQKEPAEINAAVENKREAEYLEITVKRGDVLERIARANGTTVPAIKQANGLKGERLAIGQLLRIPVGEKQGPAAALEVGKAMTSEEGFYEVKSGDNPWNIAKQFHINFEELLKLNDLDEGKARNLKIGQRLRVR